MDVRIRDSVVGVRHVVNQFAGSLEFRIGAEALQLSLQLRFSGMKIEPANNPENRVVPVGQIEEEFGLLDHLPGLYCYRPAKIDPFEERLQIFRQKIPLEHVMLFGHPDVVVLIIAPEVLV